MTTCGRMYKLLDELLEERKTLDEIGNELCDSVMIPRLKAMRLIKAYKGEQYLKDNAEWLGYDKDSIPASGGHSLGGRKNIIGKDLEKNVDVPERTELPTFEELPCEYRPPKPIADNQRKCPVCGRGIYDTLKDLWEKR